MSETITISGAQAPYGVSFQRSSSGGTWRDGCARARSCATATGDAATGVPIGTSSYPDLHFLQLNRTIVIDRQITETISGPATRVVPRTCAPASQQVLLGLQKPAHPINTSLDSVDRPNVRAEFRIEKDIDHRCSDRRRGTTYSSGATVQGDDCDSRASCGRQRLYRWSAHGEHLPIWKRVEIAKAFKIVEEPASGKEPMIFVCRSRSPQREVAPLSKRGGHTSRASCSGPCADRIAFARRHTRNNHGLPRLLRA